MDNKKIPTWLGVMIIIIFSVTTLAFVMAWKNKKTGEIRKETINTNEKTVDACTNSSIKTSDDQAIKYLLTEDGYYRSVNHGLEFRLGNLAKDEFVYEDESGIRTISEYQPHSCNNEWEEKLKGKFVSINGRQFMDFHRNDISFLKKSSDETIQQALTRLIKSEGKNPLNCDIKIIDMGGKEGEGKKYAIIQLSENAKVTETDINSFIKANPSFTKDGPIGNIVRSDKLEKLCSKYAEDSRYGKWYFWDENNKTELVGFSHLGDSWINPYTIRFFDEAELNHCNPRKK
jgi:hypothetical protein